MSERAELAVLSHGLPEAHGRSSTGYQIILDELLSPIPHEKIVYVGIGRNGPSEAAVVRLPWPRRPSRRSESIVAGASALASAHLTAPWLARRFPHVRRILGLVDPLLPVAVRWAELSDAELWLYAIDLHAETFWGAHPTFTRNLHRWRRRAWARANRAFALSPGLATWLVREGVRCPVEVLPPLIGVGERLPMPAPTRPLEFVYVGMVYSANLRPLKWLETAAAAWPGQVSLRLLTSQSPESLRGHLDLSRWTLSHASRDGVVEAVARSAWTVIALDPDPALDWRLPFCWPTKLREYLAVGRPVLCIAGRDYDIAKLAIEHGWGLVAGAESEIPDALARALEESPNALETRAHKAHDFARARMDNASVGAAWRESALSFR